MGGNGLSGNTGFSQSDYNNEINRQNLRETGNIYDIEGQEIPDILTGEIFRPAHKKPDAEVYQPTKIANEPTTKITSSVTPQSINPYGTGSVVKP